MKKLMSLVLMMTIVGITYAQPQKGERTKRKFSAEQMAELKVKQMTLALDLNKSQQAKVHDLIQDGIKEREAFMKDMKAKRAKGEKPGDDDLFKMKSTQLDKKIAHQNEMKSILSETQYESWKKSTKHRATKKHGAMKRGKQMRTKRGKQMRKHGQMRGQRGQKRDTMQNRKMLNKKRKMMKMHKESKELKEKE